MSLDRICFVSHSAYGYFVPSEPAGGGAQRQMYLLSQAFKDDYDVHFIVGDYGQQRIEERDGVTLHRSYSPTPGLAKWRRVSQVRQLFLAMRAADADVYVYCGYPRKVFPLWLCTRLLQSTFVFHVASDRDVENSPSKWIDPTWFAIKHSEGIIAQTEKQQSLLANDFGLESTVVPNGYPEATDTAPLEDRDGFLWVGRISKDNKRPHLFLELAEKVPEANFRIAGIRDNEPEYYERIKVRCRSLENVDFLGRVPPDEIHGYYRNATALINTSRYEGFPNTFVEAWRYNTPVLSLSVDPGRFISEPYDGCADDSIEQLTKLVRDVHKSIERREALSQLTHRYFQKKLTIDSVAKQYESVLQRTL